MDKEGWQEKGAGHRQRLREKFLNFGLSSFTDAEVLELLLTFGTPRKDCKEPARALLNRFGSLARALDASASEIQQVKGIGPINAFALPFIQAVAGRYVKQSLDGKEYLNSSKQVADYLIHSMRDLKIEVLNVIFLDASYGIIGSEVVAQGTLTSNTIYPRELIKAALDRDAAALVIAHNHPSGNRTPSAEDKKLTKNLFLALSLINIKLLDHFIVAGSEAPYSFADHGLMATIAEECAGILKEG